MSYNLDKLIETNPIQYGPLRWRLGMGGGQNTCATYYWYLSDNLSRIIVVLKAKVSPHNQVPSEKKCWKLLQMDDISLFLSAIRKFQKNFEKKIWT